MTIGTFTGIELISDDGKVQRFVFASDEYAVKENLSEELVRQAGIHVGITDNDDQWDFDVYLYKDEYYVNVLANPPGIMTRLIAVDGGS